MKDLKAIQELNLKLFEKEYKEYDPKLNMDWTFGKDGTKFFTSRIKNGFAAVAETDGKTIGYIVGGKAKDYSYRIINNTAELDNMFVLEPYRNQKIGTMLVEAFLNWCKEKEYGHIKVSAVAQNEAAIRFYRKFGFNDYTLTLERF